MIEVTGITCVHWSPTINKQCEMVVLDECDGYNLCSLVAYNDRGDGYNLCSLVAYNDRGDGYNLCSLVAYNDRGDGYNLCSLVAYNDRGDEWYNLCSLVAYMIEVTGITCVHWSPTINKQCEMVVLDE